MLAKDRNHAFNRGDRSETPLIHLDSGDGAPQDGGVPRRRAPSAVAPRSPDVLDAGAALETLRLVLLKQGSAQRAAAERRYLKSDLDFLGVGVPVVRREAKAFVRAHPELGRKDLRAIAEHAWSSRVHELRSVAIAILECGARWLDAADARWLIALVRGANTWAHVDWLAIKVLGPLVAHHPSLGRELDRWAEDDNFWVRRTALLAWHDLLMAGQGDFDHFARLALPMLGDREFFIRKAIGWVLRSTAKRTPERTYRFVEEHARELSGLSFREATRNLPEAQQERLRARRGG